MGKMMLLAVFSVTCFSIPVISANEDCFLPSESGMCRAYMPSYFFNSQTKECEQFIYGGCGGNGNRFATVRECRSACCVDDICKLPQEVGPCEALMPSWYFNVATCRCERFNYGGCDGNTNRFATESECENFCGEVQCLACDQPMDSGDCRGSIRRWYYDQTSNSCNRFTYSGCGGNANNFADRRACNGHCRCSLPLFVGPRDQGERTRRWYYDPRTHRCRRFRWGGVEANGNNFESRRSCRVLCMRR